MHGYNINDGIPSSLCSIKYITIDDAINQILSLGRGTMMAKIDIECFQITASTPCRPTPPDDELEQFNLH